MKKLKNTIFGIGVLFVLLSGCSNGSTNNPDGIPDGWIIETVGRAEEDDETSLALDSNGNPHISYNQGTELGYAYKDAGGWHVETADHSTYVGAESSIALDSNNYPHISYYDYYTNEDLKYAYKDAGGWHVETVYSPGDSGRSTSIALDDSEYPCICFSAGNGVYYIYQDGSGWNDIEYVGGGLDPEMVLDADYYPHVAYSHYNVDAGEQYLKYAYKDGSGWYSEIVLDTGHSVNYPSLALDSNGYPHILYYYLEDPAYENKLKYAYKDGSGWHVETVNEENGAYYISLEIDSSGYPHAAFHYWGYSSLKYIYRDGSGWHSETVEDYTDYDIGVGMYPSLVLDTAGNPHISYTYYNDDEGDEDLKYARLSP